VRTHSLSENFQRVNKGERCDTRDRRHQYMVGGEIVRTLSQQGIPARALTRNSQTAPNLPGITCVTGDLAKPQGLPAAFEGAETLFLFRVSVKTPLNCSTTAPRRHERPGLTTS
jgi:nucleoside-diphosphate-sugar epimerase